MNPQGKTLRRQLVDATKDLLNNFHTNDYCVVVSPPAITVTVQQSVRLEAVLKLNGIPTTHQPLFSWASSDSAIASVDGTGEVTGMAAGQTRIKATDPVYQIFGIGTVSVNNKAENMPSKAYVIMQNVPCGKSVTVSAHVTGGGQDYSYSNTKDGPVCDGIHLYDNGFFEYPIALNARTDYTVDFSWSGTTEYPMVAIFEIDIYSSDGFLRGAFAVFSNEIGGASGNATRHFKTP